jgi:flagellar protein FlgJ
MIDSISLNAAAPAQQDTPEKVKSAASQFEGLLIGEMLKSARESGDGGWMGTGDDAGSDSAMGLAEQYFAQSMSASGGLGLARLIEKGLAAKQAESV